MGCHNLIHNSMEFLFFRLIYSVVVIMTDYRLIRRNYDNVHLVNITELLLLGLSRTGHTGLLCKLIKEVLECDGCKRSALAADIYMLLRLDGLMKSVGIAAARHNTSRKLIYNQDLVVLHHIILIAEHQVVGAQCKNNIMLNLQVLRIRQVLYMEEFLHFLDAGLCQIDHLVLLIDNEVARLLNLFTHDGRYLCKFG